MIRINQLKIKADHNEAQLRQAVIKKLRIRDTGLLDFIIIKKSLDARKKGEIYYVYTIDVHTTDDAQLLNNRRLPFLSEASDPVYHYPEKGEEKLENRPVVIGTGPAGMFAAYFLAGNGYCPVIIERGSDVDKRSEQVKMFWETGILDPESNMQFGEGGAGTFSDGKLNTGVRDPGGRNMLVLKTFVENGAPEEILYLNKPHLGTDVLTGIMRNMRNRIIRWGGQFYFNTCFEEFIIKNNSVIGIRTRDKKEFLSGCVILAIGHSARDTYDYLIKHTPLLISAKPFAVGVRAEHRQEDINKAQYGTVSGQSLPPADYKLTYRTVSGRSVYSFCMCPGGYVVNSSSVPGYSCVNGMSYSGRDSQNANSAIVAAVSPSDDPVKNIAFQMEIEEKTYRMGRGAIVSQLFSDFEINRISTEYGSILPCHKGITVFENINQILPADICSDITEAMHAFSKRIKGFDAPDVILSAVESRTSSPLRIIRNEMMESNISGIYPVGEGAGYAGGITSAAIDGIKAFEKIYSRYSPCEVTI